VNPRRQIDSRIRQLQDKTFSCSDCKPTGPCSNISIVKRTSVSTGEHKAVYCYPFAHYDYWEIELPSRELPMRVFGETFTTDGFVEESVHLGDRFSVGSAEVVVIQPRLPATNLA